jgi:hypothetical protein
MPHVYRYQSGQEVSAGDRVIYHGEPGEIEFVVSEAVGDPALDWYFNELGGGFMVLAKPFGRVFIPGTQVDEDEDLVFVSRGGPG